MENQKAIPTRVLTKKERSKYIGTQLMGRDITDKITKEEFAAIAYYFAQRLGHDGYEIDAIVREYNTLCENEIIYKKPINL